MIVVGVHTTLILHLQHIQRESLCMPVWGINSSSIHAGDTNFLTNESASTWLSFDYLSGRLGERCFNSGVIQDDLMFERPFRFSCYFGRYNIRLLFAVHFHSHSPLSHCRKINLTTDQQVCSSPRLHYSHHVSGLKLFPRRQAVWYFLL